ncbi:DRTGG domain-containing protein [Mesotoga prima MesG1.Ag.4.2]|uniref:DRTGG domain-containing protein n=2 Tax=Kosmotogaceae TaxID=1643948 RepID=I2F2U8_9BACT|nr:MULTISPECIES: hypothetical protein [Mesotoga]AFK06251.1 DRTGG domain-containing protein [Mesotoga prima MesG1.Ag.4.2]PIJ62056.1 hypothetical protein V513_05440 [Mesotoga sp. H07.pep.5.3]
MMTLSRIIEILGCEILYCGDGDPEVESVGAADLMSDVLAFGGPGMILVTGLNSPQCVRTASVVGATAVVIIRKRNVPETTIELAKELDMPLVHARMSMYRACGILFNENLGDSLEEGKHFD